MQPTPGPSEEGFGRDPAEREEREGPEFGLIFEIPLGGAGVGRVRRSSPQAGPPASAEATARCTGRGIKSY